MAAIIVESDQDLRVRYYSERDPYYQLIRHIWAVEQYLIKRTVTPGGVNGSRNVEEVGVWELRSEHHNKYEGTTLVESGLERALYHVFKIIFEESMNDSATSGIIDLISVDVGETPSSTVTNIINSFNELQTA